MLSTPPLGSQLQRNYHAFLVKLATEEGSFYPDSDNGILEFLKLDETIKKEYIDSTKISITEEEFYFARRFLALIYLTGGEHFTKNDGSQINHREVYKAQEILPANFDSADEVFITDGSKTLDDRIEHLASKITSQQVDKFYQRLVEKRPSYFYGEDDTTPQKRYNLEGKGSLDVENYISYAEMGVSAMIQVAGKTNFINDGDRYNAGIISKIDDHQKEGHIVGLIGPRVEIGDAMEPLQLVKGKHKIQKDLFLAKISSKKSTADFGRIRNVNQEFVEGHELIWNKFYLGQSELANEGQLIEERLKHRLYISYKKFLAHAVANSSDQKKAYIRVSGIGDGSWCLGKAGFAEKIGLAVGGAFAKALSELSDEQKSKIGTVHFSQFKHENYQKGFDKFFETSPNALATKTDGKIIKFGDIKISSCRDAPFSSKLPADALDQELFNLYAWDAGSRPGNEIFHRKPTLSGDPAAACCSAIGVTANPNVNKALLTSIQIVKKDYTSQDLTQFKPQEVVHKIKAPDPVLASASSDSGVTDSPVNEVKIQEMERVLKDLFGVDKVTTLKSAKNFYINFPIASGAEFDNAFQQASSVSEYLKNHYQIKGGEGRDKKSVVAHIDKEVNYQGEKEALKGQSNLHSVGILLTFQDVDQIIEKQKEIQQKKDGAEKFKSLMSSNVGVDISIEPFHHGDVSCGISLGKDKAKAEGIIQELFDAGIARDGGGSKTLIAVNKENGSFCFDGSLSQDQIKEYKIILSEANKTAIEGSVDGKFDQIFKKVKDAQENKHQTASFPSKATGSPIPVEDLNGNGNGNGNGNENENENDPKSHDQNCWDKSKPWIGAGVAGLGGFGAVLLSSSALGLAVVSAPVIVPAVIVGGFVATAVFVAVKSSQAENVESRSV